METNIQYVIDSLSMRIAKLEVDKAVLAAQLKQEREANAEGSGQAPLQKVE